MAAVQAGNKGPLSIVPPAAFGSSHRTSRRKFTKTLCSPHRSDMPTVKIRLTSEVTLAEMVVNEERQNPRIIDCYLEVACYYSVMNFSLQTLAHIPLLTVADSAFA